MQVAGFNTLLLHNQVPTLGEWGWVLGTKSPGIDLKSAIKEIDLGTLETRWLTNDALTALCSFGKEVFPKNTDEIDINKLHDPVLYKYYLAGRWDVY